MNELIVRRGEEDLAWASLWLVETLKGHTLLAIPKLHLSQAATLDLTARMPYGAVFRDCTVALEGADPQSLTVVHATFDLFTTGEPYIVDFAAILIHPEHPSPHMGEAITRTAKMLRGV